MENSAVPSVSAEEPTPPPSSNPVSRMLHITKLVRPYTVPVLKEMLRKSGTILDDSDHFWIDGIKSQCIVTYSTEEEAEATRNLLHSAIWPLSSSQRLIVDFIKEDEFKERSSVTSVAPTTLLSLDSKRPERASTRPHIDRPTVEKLKITVASNKETGEAQRDVALARDIEKRAERREREREMDQDTRMKHEAVVPQKENASPEKAVEREWDRGKDQSAQKEPVKDEESATPLAEGNRLEVLFQRTETKPQLYWKPLTDEEIKAREEETGRARIGDIRRTNDDFKPKFLDRSRNDSPARPGVRRESPARRSRSRNRVDDRGYRGGGSGGGGRGYSSRGGSSYRRRPSPRRASPSRRRSRSRSPNRYRSGRRSRSPSRNRTRRW